MKKAVLALETATEVCSVAVHDETHVLVDMTLRRKQQHATALAPLIDEVMRWTPGGWDALGAVAVSAGPGSYTGLRIGISTAKGLCAARDLDLVSVPTLDALALQAAPHLRTGEHLVVVLPSRRGEVYAQTFAGTDIGIAALAPPEARAIADLHRWLSDTTPWLLAGPAAELLRPALPDARILSPSLALPRAYEVAVLGHARWQQGQTESVADFEPDYLKSAHITRPAVPS